jgi:hypothetical protein
MLFHAIVFTYLQLNSTRARIILRLSQWNRRSVRDKQFTHNRPQLLRTPEYNNIYSMSVNMDRLIGLGYILAQCEVDEEYRRNDAASAKLFR